MKTYRILFTAAAAMLALAACNKNGGETIAEREELRLSGEISTPEVQTANLTRASVAFTAATKFSLFVADNTAGKIHFSDLRKSTATAGATGTDKNPITLDKPLYWDDLGGRAADLNLYGVYPHTASPALNTSEITWNITSSVANSDLMRAMLQYDYADRATAAHLQFKHVLSKITIVVKPGTDTGYTKGELATAKVTYHIPTQVTYDFVEDETVATTPGDIILSPGTDVDGDGNKTYTILSYPLEEDALYKLATISIEKTGRTDTYDVKFDAAVAMEPGKHYVYNVSVHKSEITVTASVTDWEDPIYKTVETKFIDVDDIDIENATDTKITDGTLLYLYVVDSKGKEGNTTYKYTEDETSGDWELLIGKKHLYWDDFDRNFTIKALLMIDGTNDGDHILTASGTASEVTKTIDLEEFTRPFSKITVKVETSSGDDKVNLAGLKYIEFTGSNNYKIEDEVTVSAGTGLVKALFGTSETEVNAYILPYSVGAGGTLCKIAILETAEILNTYNLKFDNPTTWEAGKHYTYTVTITKTATTITASVTDWVSGDGGNIDSKLD